MATLNVLLINYLFVLLINLVLSIFCFFIYRDRLYVLSTYLWLGTFFNLMLQGIFQTHPLPMSLAYSTSFFVFLVEIKILSRVTRIHFPVRNYSLFMAGNLVLSIVANAFGLEFFWVALPVSIGMSFTMFHTAIKAWRSPRSRSNQGGVKIFSVLIVLLGLHLLDYPFLRMQPDFAVFGFSIALILFIAFSIFLPSFILGSISKRYVKKMEAVNGRLVDYQKQMSELISLAQLGEMSYSFVHDMASPTNILLYYSTALNSANAAKIPKGEELLSYSKGIEKATSRLMNLQKMFKTMIYEGDQKKAAQVDLREVFQNCSDLFAPFLARNEIQMEAMVQTENTVIMTISGAIDRILLNLIQNAANALVESPTRKIILLLEKNDSDQIVLSVQDTGPGISPERMAGLWERFGHSDTSKKAKASHPGVRSGGTGFGLYKVRQLVDQIHGKIDVESSSSGTVFRMILPRELPASQEQPLKSAV